MAVSPRVEAPVLAVLHPEVTKIVVTALEERGAGRALGDVSAARTDIRNTEVAAGVGSFFEALSG